MFIPRWTRFSVYAHFFLLLWPCSNPVTFCGKKGLRDAIRPWTPWWEYPTVYLTSPCACIVDISILTCLNSNSPNIFSIEFLILPNVTSILPFFFFFLISGHKALVYTWLHSSFSFSFLFHSLLESISQHSIYIWILIFVYLYEKNMFITKCLSSHHLLGPTGSSFLTWIITVAAESLTVALNPLMSIFTISPRWIFSKPKLHHITHELGTTAISSLYLEGPVSFDLIFLPPLLP